MCPFAYCMLYHRIAYDPLNDAHSARGGLLVSGGTQTSLQKAKATAASREGDLYHGLSVMHWRNLQIHITLPSVCRCSEDYAKEEHALFVWSSLTKTSRRLSTHLSVRQGVALDRKQCYL